jgi:hypothetical protein
MTEGQEAQQNAQETSYDVSWAYNIVCFFHSFFPYYKPFFSLNTRSPTIATYFEDGEG